MYGIKTMAPRSRIKYKDNRLKMIEIVAKMLAARMRYFQKQKKRSELPQMANTETGLNMARNRGQSAADVADATRAAFHLTASAHPTKIKH